MNTAYGSAPDSLADTRLVEPPKANTAGIGQSGNASMAPGMGAQGQNSAMTRGGNRKPMLSASGVPAMHAGLDDDVPEEAVPEEEEKKRNYAYRSAPDDYADTGLINPINQAYDSRPDGMANTGLVKPPKFNQAYGSAPDSKADTGLGKNFIVNTAYGSEADDLADKELVLPQEKNTPAYNASDSVNYALEWANGQNYDYYNYDGSYDCANFVSQCLAAGGIPMDDQWYSFRKDFNPNEYYTQLKLHGDIWALATSTDYPRFYDWDVGEPWRRADDQYHYFKDSEYSTGTGYFEQDDIQMVASLIKPGDLLYFDKDGDGVIDHATIVTNVEDNMIQYSAHSNPRINEPITTFFEDASNGKTYYVQMRG